MRGGNDFDKWFQACFGKPKPEARLHRAAEDGDCETLKQLLAAGVSPDSVHLGLTALVAATERGQLASVRELLRAGANPNDGGTGYPPLFRAAFLRNLSLITELIKSGADVNRTAGTGAAILAYICMYGYAEVAEALIGSGAAINQPGNTANVVEDTEPGMTPLMLASMFGQLAVVKLLLAKGAEVNCRDKKDHTALDWARGKRTKKHFKIVKLLEEAGGQTNKTLELRVRPEENFEEVAQQPDFEKAVKKIRALTGKRGRRIANAEGTIVGAVGFSLPAGRAKALVTEFQASLLQQGCYLLHTCDPLEGKPGDGVAVFPTTDVYKVLEALQTEGPNSDVYNPDLICWLRALEDPLQVTGAGSDFVEGRFTAPIKDPDALAERIISLCPEGDVGRDSAKKLAEQLKKTGELFLWWD